MNRKWLSAIAPIIGLSLCATVSSAATAYTWNGSANGNWFVGSNWTPTGVPTTSDTALVQSGSILLTNSTGPLASFTITNATLTFTNWTTALRATTVRIRKNGTLTHSLCVSTSVMTNRVWIRGSNVTIEANGKIDVTGKGYATGPGNSAGQRAGAGYGGKGGYCQGANGVPYGSPWAPLDPGSGRDASHRGGGAVRIEASGHVQIDGTIKANGQESTSGYSGEGAGGGVYITCRTFGSVGGVITASGDPGNTDSTGGGGGRIAVLFNASAQRSQSRPGVRLDAAGGALGTGSIPAGSTAGEMGTICLTDGQLIRASMLDWNGQLYGPTNWSWPAITMSRSSLRIGGPYNLSPSTIDVAGNLSLRTNSALTVYSGPTNATGPWTNYGARLTVSNTLNLASNCWIYPNSHSANGGSILFEVSNLTVAAWAGINADARGYAAGSGPGRCKLEAGGRTGGGYGGRGQYYSATRGGDTYGSSNAPVAPGSGGGSGYGGGLIRMVATRTITVDGTLTANGQDVGSWTGAGSGGGIFLRCRTFGGATSGRVSARGGNSGSTDASSGGGGRIAIRRAESAYFGTFSYTSGVGSTVYSPVAQPGTLVISNIVLGGTHKLTVAASPARRGSPSPAYGEHLYDHGEAITNRVNSPADRVGGLRYACLGWRLTNAAGYVNGDSTTQTVVQVNTNLWLTWRWTNQYLLTVSSAIHGSLAANPSGWYTNAMTVLLQGIPDSGYYFLQWSGDVPPASLTNSSIAVVMNQPRTIMAHFASTTPQSKGWTGTGNWFTNFSGWSPAGAPGRADVVTVSSGTATLTDPTSIRSLDVAGGALRVSSGANVGRLSVSEGVAIGAAAMTVTNGDLLCGGTLTLASGGTLSLLPGAAYRPPGGTGVLVRVSGAMTVGNNCWVYPYSHPTSGVSAVFSVGSLNIEGPNGGINADAKGFSVTYGPGRGISSQTRQGGAYGGYGGGQVLNNRTYGSSNAPVHCGSPGYASDNSGGRGGGLVTIRAGGPVTVNGVLSADGQSVGGYNGAGSGGGINVTCSRFAGSATGVVRARGGSGGGQDSAGGGGGRIAIRADSYGFAGIPAVDRGTTYLNYTIQATPGTVVLMISQGSLFFLR